MKQLTDAEKRELEAKIQEEKERQQALRESNPDLPETFEAASAKTGILAFGVKEGYRRQGIGRALQEYTIKQAKMFGCYQVRSVSGENHPENHHLKLSMGFAVEPMERDEKCLAFVMPLKSPERR